MKRLFVSVLAWLACYPALRLSMGMALGSVMEFKLRWHGVHPEGPIGQDAAALVNAAGLAGFALAAPSAWLLLATMTVAWIRDHRLQPWRRRLTRSRYRRAFAQGTAGDEFSVTAWPSRRPGGCPASARVSPVW